ncbi:MAG: hypothetical protein KatS3mg105_5043 [Gemmatales bacterium]|nr:MAG: hypothetical protein KatS3mg105_5043 [Gemmatales bacterium]
MIKVTKDLTKEQIQAIEAIYRRYGRIKAQDILEEAQKSSASCLHDLFTWSDAVAAEKYRRIEARLVIKAYQASRSTRERKSERSTRSPPIASSAADTGISKTSSATATWPKKCKGPFSLN